LLFLGGAVDASVGGDVAGDVGVLPGPSVGMLDDKKTWEEKGVAQGGVETQEGNG
jgi:hypothetical protein